MTHEEKLALADWLQEQEEFFRWLEVYYRPRPSEEEEEEEEIKHQRSNAEVLYFF